MNERPALTTDDVEQPAKNDATAKPPVAKPTAGPVFHPFRIWPAVLLLICLWGLRLIPSFAPETTLTVMMLGFMGPIIFAGLIALWWLFLSRGRLSEKAVGLVGLAVIAVVTISLADKSIQGMGAMLYVIPWGMTGFAVACMAVARATSFRRTWIALLGALICFAFWDTVRTDEIWGNFKTARSWRWEPTSEERFLESLAARPDRPVVDAGDREPLAEPDWPAFRGPNRDGSQPGIVLREDWQANPLRELWRARIGPGWSSFSVAGNQLFTQEQRGEDEVVVCYQASTGQQIWVHAYPSRFWEAVGGTGPRGTPTLSQGNLFALGAAGILHRLDPVTGKQVWKRDIGQDAGREPPTWGYASSPLVTHGVVIVHAGGPQDKGVLAYDVETGDLRWSSPAGDHGYSSAQLSSIHGKPYVLMLTNQGLTILDPASGELRGQHDWEFEGYRVVQPLVLSDSSVLLGTSMGTGTQRVALRLDGDKLISQEKWVSRRMSPTFNDYVAHQGYLYGFDNNIFACVDLANGARQWKKGRYGNGQVLLLPDGDQLLVLAEDGELVLLQATPDSLVELARHQVLEGRTWNHPVMVGNRLYVRNGEEAACFEMPIEEAMPH